MEGSVPARYLPGLCWRLEAGTLLLVSQTGPFPPVRRMLAAEKFPRWVLLLPGAGRIIPRSVFLGQRSPPLWPAAPPHTGLRSFGWLHPPTAGSERQCLGIPPAVRRLALRTPSAAGQQSPQKQQTFSFASLLHKSDSCFEYPHSIREFLDCNRYTFALKNFLYSIPV